MDRGQRALLVKRAADRLGIAAHTLRRYMVLDEFLSEVGIVHGEAARLSVGPLEVVLRLWRRDRESAAAALRAIRLGTLTFRGALALERRVKARGPVDTRADQAEDGDLRAEIAGLLARGGEALVERSVIDDQRFDIVQVSRIFATDTSSVAYLDEASASQSVGGDFPFFARTILLAAALFDLVAVRLSFESSHDRLDALSKLARPDAFGNVRVLAPRLVLPEGFEEAEG